MGSIRVLRGNRRNTRSTRNSSGRGFATLDLPSAQIVSEKVGRSRWTVLPGPDAPLASVTALSTSVTMDIGPGAQCWVQEDQVISLLGPFIIPPQRVAAGQYMTFDGSVWPGLTSLQGALIFIPQQDAVSSSTGEMVPGCCVRIPAL